jgi:LacI family transcriptional regulator
MDEYHYSKLREMGFRERLEAAKGPLGGRYMALNAGGSAWWLERRPAAVMDFLASIEEPTGLYCANDKIAERISHFARELGIHTPEPLSLLGTDDDELSMLASGKGLSSIKPDYPGIGRTAARLMLKLLKGQPAPTGEILLPPLELVARESSDFAANVDPRMGKAIRFIQNNACGRIRIEDVLKQVPMSRRHFEIQFKQTFGSSPYEEIIHIRIQAARNLLRHSPELTVAEVADRCGYDNSKQFSVAFRKVVGLTPSQFREHNREDAVSAP